MPSIIREDKQVQALNEITNALNEIKVLNNAISGKLGVFIVVEQTAKKTMKIQMEAKDTQRIMAVVIARKNRLVKDIRTKAVKHRIELSPEDLALMDEAIEASENSGDQRKDEGEAAEAPDTDETDIDKAPGISGEFFCGEVLSEVPRQ